MRRDNRLSRMLHVLIHMDETDALMTSEQIAGILGTNPVVVRRTMAGLRELGYVSSEKGHGGGWQLTQPLNAMSLLDVYRALGEPPIFAFGLSDDRPDCLVEQSVNNALSQQLDAAREQLLKGFAEIRLSDIAADFHEKWKAFAGSGEVCRSAHQK